MSDAYEEAVHELGPRITEALRTAHVQSVSWSWETHSKSDSAGEVSRDWTALPIYAPWHTITIKYQSHCFPKDEEEDADG